MSPVYDDHHRVTKFAQITSWGSNDDLRTLETGLAISVGSYPRDPYVRSVRIRLQVFMLECSLSRLQRGLPTEGLCTCGTVVNTVHLRSVSAVRISRGVSRLYQVLNNCDPIVLSEECLGFLRATIKGFTTKEADALCIEVLDINELWGNNCF